MENQLSVHPTWMKRSAAGLLLEKISFAIRGLCQRPLLNQNVHGGPTNVLRNLFTLQCPGLKRDTWQNSSRYDFALKNVNWFGTSPGTTATFLLVDDDEDDREMFALALQEVSKDVVCVTCKNGKEAIERLSHLRPDHIFVDINMPVMSGKDCLGEIRKLGHLNEVPVHMFTTASRVLDEEVYSSMGAQGILTKPVRMAELVSMLKTCYHNDHAVGKNYTQ